MSTTVVQLRGGKGLTAAEQLYLAGRIDDPTEAALTAYLQAPVAAALSEAAIATAAANAAADRVPAIEAKASIPLILSITPAPVAGQIGSPNPTVAGSADPGSVVYVYAGPSSSTLALAATLNADEAGAWSYTFPAQLNGPQIIMARALPSGPALAIDINDPAGTSLAMTQLQAGRTFQRTETSGGAFGAGGGSIPVSIRLGEDVALIEYRLRDAATGAVITDWTTAATNVARTARTLACPNIAARKGWFLIDLRADGGPPQLGTSPVGMGGGTLIMGQSLAVRMLGRFDNQTITFDNLGIVPGTFGTVYATFTDTGGALVPAAWAAPLDGSSYDSAFVADFLNRTVEAMGCNWFVAGAPVGSQPIANFVPGGSRNAGTRAVMSAIGGFEEVIWYQGHSDAKVGSSSSYYQAQLTALFNDFTAYNGVRGSSYRKAVATIGAINSALWGTPFQINTIRSAARAWAAANGAAYVGANDFTLVDGVHQTQAGNLALVRHFYRALRNSDVGPSLGAGTRPNGSLVVTIPVSFPAGATALTTVGSFAPRLKLFLAGTTSPVALTSVSVGAAAITANLQYDPGNGAAFDAYAYFPNETGNAASDGNVYDDHVGDTFGVGRQLQVNSTPAIVAAPTPGGPIIRRVGPDLTMTSPTYATGGFTQRLTGGYGVSQSATDHLPTASAVWTMECKFSVGTPAANAILMGASVKCYVGVHKASGRMIVNYRSVNGDIFMNGTDLNNAGTMPVIPAGDHHLEIVANALSVMVFLDGILVAANTSDAPAATAPGSVFGVRTYGASLTGFIWAGTVDEVAIWSVARHSANFTPPTAAYTGQEMGLTALWHLDGNGQAATYTT